MLDRLDACVDVRDMDLPGYRLHPLRGQRAGFWATTVSGNWRLTVRFEGEDAFDVDYEDYH
jgi:proteic killer suppression protein